MTDRPVLLIGFRDQDNLGLGYMAAVLARGGFASELVDFCARQEHILACVREANPLIVGLSIIFQYYTPDFARLVAFLRANGVTCPICAGGHYPSLRPEKVLAAIPELDCVIRFEGEYTLLEMAQRVAGEQDWRDLPSIAYRASDGGVVATRLRPLIADLDSLPFPRRWNLENRVLGLLAVPILASRGCPRGCSFCSIRKFYSTPPGKLRRVRSPANVVAEMRELFDRHGARVFLFQDDDFPLLSRKDREWACDFVEHLETERLAGEVIWKVSCRSDEVEPEIFQILRRGGLYSVYLGIESGNAEGLRTLNKQISVEQNLKAVATLKQMGIKYEFGFMLFDPSSSFESVMESLAFLRKTCGDGSATAVFSRMAPFAGTEIEERLRQEGRLLGNDFDPSYMFPDPRLEAWFQYLYAIFQPLALAPENLLAKLRAARFELAVLRHFWPHLAGQDDYGEAVQDSTACYNELYCRIVEDSAPYFISPALSDGAGLQAIAAAAEEQRRRIDERLIEARNRLVEAARVRQPLV